MLACDLAFCIYQKDGSCILTSVAINSLDMCDCAITIDLSDEKLCQRKTELLEKLKCQEKEWETEKP